MTPPSTSKLGLSEPLDVEHADIGELGAFEAARGQDVQLFVLEQGLDAHRTFVLHSESALRAMISSPSHARVCWLPVRAVFARSFPG